MTTPTRTAEARPRHQNANQRGPAALAIRWLLTFRWNLFGLFLSDLGRSMVTNKYDAFTTDNGYGATAVGGNFLSRAVDRVVRRRDTHVALRQRLEIVTTELTSVVLSRRKADGVRLVSGPVGLGRDLRVVWGRLERLGTHPADWLEVIGLDLDASGTVLAEASRLAGEEGIPLETYQLTLLDTESLVSTVGGPVDCFNMIGLSTWLDQAALEEILVAIRTTLTDDGVLVIDHWRRHRGSKYVGALEMPARYVTDEEFETTLSNCGFVVEDKRETANAVVVIYRAGPA